MSKIWADTYCDLCLKFMINTPLFGEFLHNEDYDRYLDFHYYCLLSSTDLPQRGRSNQGIRGFLVKDIVKNIIKIDENECYICHRKSAAVKCAEEGCEKFFHYPCGRIYGCITQFIGDFKSFCSGHVPVTNVMRHNRVRCSVCDMVMSHNHPASVIFSKCCKDVPTYNPLFTEDDIQSTCFTHADCVQRYVVNAGYDSKCINCEMKYMTKKQWQDQMRMKGIFIPQQMAVWENDDLYDFKQQTKNKCSMKDCPNPNVTSNVWTCFSCGCIPVHLECAKVKSHEDYLCHKCFDQSFVNLIPGTSKN